MAISWESGCFPVIEGYSSLMSKLHPLLLDSYMIFRLCHFSFRIAASQLNHTPFAAQALENSLNFSFLSSLNQKVPRPLVLRHALVAVHVTLVKQCGVGYLIVQYQTSIPLYSSASRFQGSCKLGKKIYLSIPFMRDHHTFQML